MAFLMLCKNSLCTSILFIDHLQYLFVNHLGSCLRIRTLEAVLIVIVVADIWKFIAHTCIRNHTIRTLCCTLKVIHCS